MANRQKLQAVAKNSTPPLTVSSLHESAKNQKYFVSQGSQVSGTSSGGTTTLRNSFKDKKEMFSGHQNLQDYPIAFH